MQGSANPVGLEVDPPDQLAVEQERPHVVAVLPFGRRSVDLDAVVEPEQPLDPRPEEDQRIEWAQQRCPTIDARNLLPCTQIGRPRPPFHVHLLQFACRHQVRQCRLDLCGAQPEVVAYVGLGAHPQRGGRPQHQFPQRLGIVDLARQHVGWQHALGQVVVARKTGAVRRRQYPGGKQRFGHPFGDTAIPPGPLASAWLGLQMRLDLAGRGRSEFSDGRDDLPGQPRVLPDDLLAPPSVAVLTHPPAQQRPVVDGHQRGLMRPVLHEQPGCTGAVAPGRAVEHLPVVGTQAAEHRGVMGAHRHRHRIHLQHLDTRDQPPQVRPGEGASRLGFVKTLRSHGNPARLCGRESHCRQ